MDMDNGNKLGIAPKYVIPFCIFTPHKLKVFLKTELIHLIAQNSGYDSLINHFDFQVNSGRVCHFWCNFIPSYTCWITIVLGATKNGSLKIIRLPSNNCLSRATETCYKMASTLCQTRVLNEIGFFLGPKIKFLYILNHTIWFKISPAYVVQIRIK